MSAEKPGAAKDITLRAANLPAGPRYPARIEGQPRIACRLVALARIAEDRDGQPEVGKSILPEMVRSSKFQNQVGAAMSSTLASTVAADLVVTFQINPGMLLQFLETRPKGEPRLKCFEGGEEALAA